MDGRNGGGGVQSSVVHCFKTINGQDRGFESYRRTDTRPGRTTGTGQR